MLIIALKLLLFGATVAACVFYLFAVLAAVRFFGEQHAPPSSTLQPVSILIPLCGVDEGAYASYATFCLQDYPAYQIVFGTRDPLDPAIPTVHRLITDFPERDIALMVCANTVGANPKVSNLHNMLAFVKYEWIVIPVGARRLHLPSSRHIMPFLADPRIGLVTCLYRAAQAPTCAARLEAIGLTASFIPGVLAAWLLEGMHFALGATMATTRTTLKAIGGLQAIGDYLVDDFMLGSLVAKAGYEVCLAPYVVETVLAPMGCVGMLKHQLRWSRSRRFVRPGGYLGTVLTHGTVLASLTLLLYHSTGLSPVLLAVTLSLRLGMGWLIGVYWLQDKVLQHYFWLLPLCDLLNFGIWGLGLFGRRVEWRGRRLTIGNGGKIVQRR